jgi:hypothetical protein
MILTIKKDELIEAQNRFNKDYLENPQNYEEKITINDGTEQVEHLLSFVSEDHLTEQRAHIEAEAIASFIEYLKEEERVVLPEDCFENFLNA